MAFARALFWITISFICVPASAFAQERVALVIGNGAYRELSRLNNPASDARQVASELRANGYRVLDVYDVTREQFLDALETFRKSYVPGASEAFVFYAGHGMSAEGRDVLAPTDLGYDCDEKAGQMSVRREVPWDEVERQLRDVPNLVIVLDACRSNAFQRCKNRGPEAEGFRGLSRTARSGTLIVNSTALGSVARDGAPGQGSPFAGVLLTRMKSQPQSYYRELFDDVAREVSTLTQGTQVPEVLVRGGAPRTCLSIVCGGHTTRVEPPPSPPKLSGPPEKKPDPLEGQQIAAVKPEDKPAPEQASDAIKQCEDLATAPLANGHLRADVALDQIDTVKAIPICRHALALSQESPRIAYILGRALHKDGDDIQAREMFEKAAAKGSARAMYHLGILYAEGKAFPKDYFKVREWYEKAALRGDVEAMHNLGNLYVAGKGGEQDYTKAREFYEQAIASGNIHAAYNLGNLYLAGKGVPKDYAKARALFARAADYGNVYAMISFANLQAAGKGGPRNISAARGWLKKAKDLGSTDAVARLKELETD